MMDTGLSYPSPAQDEDNQPFLDGWRSGRLFLQQSREGGPFFFYPRPVCPYTGSTDLVWKEVSGRGRMVSYSLIMRPNHPSFNDELPIVLAEIELDEGASLLARILIDDPAQLRSGARVACVPLPEAARYPLPVFRQSGA